MGPNVPMLVDVVVIARLKDDLLPESLCVCWRLGPTPKVCLPEKSFCSKTLRHEFSAPKMIYAESLIETQYMAPVFGYAIT